MDVDIDEFVRRLLSEEPKGLNKIDMSVNVDGNNVDELFKFFIDLFTRIMKSLYGDSNGRVNLGGLSKEDIMYVRDYFKSFGVGLNVVVMVGGEEVYKYVESEMIESDDDLSSRYMDLRSEGRVYRVYFSQTRQ